MQVVNADIGGTNSRMQLWSSSNHADWELRFDRRYLVSEMDPGLEPLLRRFLLDAGMCIPEGEAAAAGSPGAYEGPVIDAACFAICGPIADEARQAGPVLPEQGPTGELSLK